MAHRRRGHGKHHAEYQHDQDDQIDTLEEQNALLRYQLGHAQPHASDTMPIVTVATVVVPPPVTVAPMAPPAAPPVVQVPDHCQPRSWARWFNMRFVATLTITVMAVIFTLGVVWIIVTGVVVLAHFWVKLLGNHIPQTLSFHSYLAFIQTSISYVA